MAIRRLTSNHSLVQRLEEVQSLMDKVRIQFINQSDGLWIRDLINDRTYRLLEHDGNYHDHAGIQEYPVDIETKLTYDDEEYT